jgi:alkanesulfonate monooxygenase SsuD/methylene tetrahydromethanopterin reductase-like flavin-dependent oxidoreductase (luciferase family)
MGILEGLLGPMPARARSRSAPTPPEVTMSDPAPVKIGALVWNQYTDWPRMREVGRRVDELGYDSLWTWDHLYPIIGDPHGPFLEGYLVLAAWSQQTSGPSIGLMVGANTFRNPGLVVKMITTLDHLSEGRAVLGIGAAWFETEHTAFGIEFGSGFGERLDWLDESVELMHGMLRDGVASARGERYHAVEARNDPAPLQPHLPILIGGAGEKKTLRTVARYADAWNVAMVTPEQAAAKEAVLRRWCDELDRDPDEIERTLSLGPMIIRDDPAEAAATIARLKASNPKMEREVLVGSGTQITDRCAEYVAAGFRHLIFHLPTPYDEETLERFATEVQPALD